MAKWFSLDTDVGLRKLSLEAIYKLHNQMFVPALAYGLAAVPLSRSLLQHLARSSTTHLIRYHRKPRHEPLDGWLHRMRGRMRDMRLSGELITPIRYIASDLHAMHVHCGTSRGAQLAAVLGWRDRLWQESVDRNYRPQMRRGGDFTEIATLDSELACYTFRRLHVA